MSDYDQQRIKAAERMGWTKIKKNKAFNDLTGVDPSASAHGRRDLLPFFKHDIAACMDLAEAIECTEIAFSVTLNNLHRAYVKSTRATKADADTRPAALFAALVEAMEETA